MERRKERRHDERRHPAGIDVRRLLAGKIEGRESWPQKQLLES